MMEDENNKWQRRFERERNARKIAENMLEEKALRVYQTNQELQDHLNTLENRIKERTQELTAAMEAAQRADQTKTEFLATISHEIRTPINGIQGMVDLLLNSELNAEQHSQAFAIQRSAKTLQAVVDDILDYSRIEVSGLELREESFDLPTLLEEVAGLIEHDCQTKGLTIEIDLSPALNKTFVGDIRRIKQVLLLLASNAVKFTEQGGIIFRANAETEHRSRSTVQFEVIDSGIGIKEEHVSELFEGFSQLDASHSRRFGGAGLGLALSKRIIESMEGKLGVDSTYGEGSIFWFAVPLGIEENKSGYWLLNDNEDNTAEPEIKVLKASAPKAGLKVLVVDDNQINCQFAQHFLHELGHECLIAENGAEAVEKARIEAVDLVLMDIQMPVMDGFEATRKIRLLGSEKGEVPIYAMSADNDPATNREAMESGMNGFLGKPIEKRVLEKVLEKVSQG